MKMEAIRVLSAVPDQQFNHVVQINLALLDVTDNSFQTMFGSPSDF